MKSGLLQKRRSGKLPVKRADKKDGGGVGGKPEAEQVVEAEGYRLHKLIGRGGFGRVWLADLAGDGGKVALKIVERGARGGAAFAKERAALERIRDIRQDGGCLLRPDRVEFHGRKGFLFYTMLLADDVTGAACVDQERYRPKSLAAELKRRGQLPVKECATVAMRVLDALRDLHGVSLCHGDVKAENVLYMKGEPVLADIGLMAPETDEAPASGTPSYMAPDHVLTPSCDIYSVGMLLYCMATGNPASRFSSLKRTVRSPLFRKLCHVYTVATDKDSRKRYVSADAMIRALQYVADPGPAWKKEDKVGVKGAGPASGKPGKEGMERFMKYIRNLIEIKRREMCSRSAPSRAVDVSESFKEFTEDLCVRFEIRIGYKPRALQTLCLIAEASMEKDRPGRIRLVDKAMRSGFGDRGMRDILDGMGQALGWDSKMFKTARDLVIGPPELPRHPFVDRILKIPKRISFARKLLRKETTRDRLVKAFEALHAGMDEAIPALWPCYGEYLEF